MYDFRAVIECVYIQSSDTWTARFKDAEFVGYGKTMEAAIGNLVVACGRFAAEVKSSEKI